MEGFWRELAQVEAWNIVDEVWRDWPRSAVEMRHL